MATQNKSLITSEEIKLAAKEIIIHQDKEVPLVQSITESLEESGIGAELQSMIIPYNLAQDQSEEYEVNEEGIPIALVLAFHLGFITGINKQFQFTPTPSTVKLH